MKKKSLDPIIENAKNILLGAWIYVSIPGLPPSVNMLYATFRGRRIKSKEGREWEKKCYSYTNATVREYLGTADLSPLKGLPLLLDITFYKPTWTAKNGSGLYVRPDLSNFIKAAEDGFLSALGLDDCAVVDLHCRKFLSIDDKEDTRIGIRLCK